MKLFKTIVTLLLFISISYAQNDCKPYIPSEKGATWELTNYNAKGKTQGIIKYELLDKITEGNNITFSIKATSYNKKNKETFSTTYEAKCIDGVFDFDMSVKMNGSSMQSFQDMDIVVDASKYELPDLSAKTGSTLADGSLKITMATTSGLGLGMTLLITDRKVEARENITTPAGSFDCVVLSQKVSTKMMIRIQGASKEWYAENIGLIRSESYNKKGKLTGYSELTMFDD